MGKRAPGHSDQLASRRPATIHIVGARPEDALGLRLKQAFSGAQFFLNLPTSPLDNADLAIGVFESSEGDKLQAFVRWAHVAGVPSLCVQLRTGEALIGPLTIAGRAGCGRCAFARLLAAAATAEPRYAGILPAHEVASVVGATLEREVRTIISEAPERSQLLDHVLAIDAQTLDASLHKFIPLPRCSICGGATAFPLPAQEPVNLSPADSPEVVLGAFAGWVDQRTGVISNLYVEPPAELGVDLPIIATAAPPHIMEEDGSLRRLPLGWGKGLRISGAVLSAVGEAIERYSAALPDAGRIIWKRPEDLDGEFMDPTAFRFYTDAQYERDDFPYVRFDPGIRHPWILGNWLSNGAPVYVLAVFAFLSLTLEREQLICQGTSNGLAAATEDQEAALRATMELVERDAFMVAWLAGSCGRRIDLDETLDPLLRRVVEGIESLGAVVEVYLLPTSKCGTTILCLGLGDGDRYPGTTIGLGADLDPHSALRQAILELGQTGPYLRRMMRSSDLAIPEDPSSVREMLDHAAYYFPRERATAFDPLRNSDAPVALRDLPADAPNRSLSNCASELDAAGVRVALVDVTSADVATGPFRVVRAVSYDLQSISYGFGLERSPVERIGRLKVASDIRAIHPIW